MLKLILKRQDSSIEIWAKDSERTVHRGKIFKFTNTWGKCK